MAKTGNLQSWVLITSPNLENNDKQSSGSVRSTNNFRIKSILMNLFRTQQLEFLERAISSFNKRKVLKERWPRNHKLENYQQEELDKHEEMIICLKYLNWDLTRRFMRNLSTWILSKRQQSHQPNISKFE